MLKIGEEKKPLKKRILNWITDHKIVVIITGIACALYLAFLIIELVVCSVVSVSYEQQLVGKAYQGSRLAYYFAEDNRAACEWTSSVTTPLPEDGVVNNNLDYAVHYDLFTGEVVLELNNDSYDVYFYYGSEEICYFEEYGDYYYPVEIESSGESEQTDDPDAIETTEVSTVNDVDLTEETNPDDPTFETAQTQPPETENLETQPVVTEPEETELPSYPAATEPEETQPSSRPTATEPEETQPSSRPTATEPEETQPSSRPTAMEPEETKPSSRPTATEPEETQPPSRPTATEPEETQPPSRPAVTVPEETQPVTRPVVTTPSCSHSFSKATCTEPEICKDCGYKQGSPLGHRYSDATCTTPQICTSCGYEQGSLLEHQYTDATCTTPRTCSVCGKTSGTATGHSWMEKVETVHHEEEGHYEEVLADTYKVTIYLCFFCGYNQEGYPSLSDLRVHMEEHKNHADYEFVMGYDDYLSDSREEWEYVYEEQWIVDQEAYDEEVVIGRRCTVCGSEEEY